MRPPCGCPRGAEIEVETQSPSALPRAARCPACGVEHPLRLESIAANGGLVACVACGHPELFLRKTFPPSIGLLIVAVAALLAPFTSYLSLVAAAAIDFVLYRRVSDEAVCYVCRARHRGFASDPRHPRFDREIEERLRYGQRAVMGKPMREGGTADAPEPEH